MNIKSWPEVKRAGLLEDGIGYSAYLYWRRCFDAVYRGEIDTWDYQWNYCCWINSGLAITPEVNLISNIGFGINATHTKRVNKFTGLQTKKFPTVLK